MTHISICIQAVILTATKKDKLGATPRILILEIFSVGILLVFMHLLICLLICTLCTLNCQAFILMSDSW